MITFEQCKFEKIESSSNFNEILDEYADECAMCEIGQPNMQPDLYRLMEANGSLFIIGAFDKDVLAGFISLVVSVLPHYGISTAVTESFFVSSKHRRDGCGLMLLKEAENVAAKLGAKTLLVSTRTGSQLNVLLEMKKSYRETNKVFAKCLR